MVERQSCKLKVLGSIPSGGSWRHSSVVEQRIAAPQVTGSIPVVSLVIIKSIFVLKLIFVLIVINKIKFKKNMYYFIKNNICMFDTIKRYLNILFNAHENTSDVEHLNYDFYVFFYQETKIIKDYNICYHCRNNILESIYMFKSKPFCGICIAKYNKCLY